MPTNCTNGHEDNALRKMATRSVALIVTNAIRGLFYDDNGGNLKLSFAGAIGNELIFAHELHGLTRRQCDTGMATGSVARIGTNAMRALFTCPVA